jgi:hypothetical protein
MDATNVVPRLLPLLGDRNIHVLRDTIRTLGVLGDASVIAHLEPFTQQKYVHTCVYLDATAAIKRLKAKGKAPPAVQRISGWRIPTI